MISTQKNFLKTKILSQKGVEIRALDGTYLRYTTMRISVALIFIKF